MIMTLTMIVLLDSNVLFIDLYIITELYEFQVLVQIFVSLLVASQFLREILDLHVSQSVVDYAQT